MKILIADTLSDVAVDELRKAGLDVTVKTGMKPDALLEVIPEFDVIAVRSATKVTKAVIDAGTRLKLVIRAGVGLDNVDAKAAAEKGIRVENTPNATTVTVAEHTMALMLALCRHIPQAYVSMKQGEWDRKSFQGVELKGKTLALIGLGRIGQEVAKRGRAFGMKVVGFDTVLNSEVAEALEIEMCSLEQAVQQADFISLHMPLTPQTKHIFGKEMFARCKKGVRIINAARGGIIDEPALADAIKAGHVAGAALDVFEQEPCGQDNPLLALKQVIFVPHLGASTDEGQVRAGLEAAKVIVEFAKK